MKLLQPPSLGSTRAHRIVSVADAAKYAGVSRAKMQRWIADGKIPTVQYPGSNGKPMRGAKIDLGDLEKFIQFSKDRKL